MKHQELHVEILWRRVGSADLDGLSSPSSRAGCLRRVRSGGLKAICILLDIRHVGFYFFNQC